MPQPLSVGMIYAIALPGSDTTGIFEKWGAIVPFTKVLLFVFFFARQSLMGETPKTALPCLCAFAC